MMQSYQKRRGRPGLAIGLGMMVACALFFVACHREPARQYKTTVDNMTLVMSSAKSYFVKGNNRVTIRIADSAGRVLKNARVDVRYFTKPRNGKPSLDVMAPAEPKEDQYELVVDIPEGGEWNTEILVRSPELKTQQIIAAFKIDVRE